jgi:polysaccharide export outer membrane protein
MFGKLKVASATTVIALSALVALATQTAAPAATMIHPGDKVAVTVFNHPDLSTEAVVTGQGDLRLPVAGNVTVDGLTEQAAADRIASALGSFLYHPSVDVRVELQSQSIFFTGSLVGVQPYTPGETLGSAIGLFRQTVGVQSGGNAATSANLNSLDLRSVRIERGKQILPAVDLDALGRAGDSGPRLEPGDVVLLRAKPIRVDVRGNLSMPTAVYVYPGDTLAQAVAEVGPLSSGTSIAAIGLRRDGTDSVVSSAGTEFTSPAHDGDVVTLQPAPHVTVLGMVEHAGDTTLQTRPTLLNALYQAGGPNRYADLANVRITHAGTTHTVDVSKLTHGDLSENPPVQDGDVVFVPEGHKIDFSLFTAALTALTSFRFVGGL